MILLIARSYPKGPQLLLRRPSIGIMLSIERADQAADEQIPAVDQHEEQYLERQ
jgi:hypothetical protein